MSSKQASKKVLQKKIPEAVIESDPVTVEGEEAEMDSEEPTKFEQFEEILRGVITEVLREFGSEELKSVDEADFNENIDLVIKSFYDKLKSANIYENLAQGIDQLTSEEFLKMLKKPKKKTDKVQTEKQRLNEEINKKIGELWESNPSEQKVWKDRAELINMVSSLESAHKCVETGVQQKVSRVNGRTLFASYYKKKTEWSIHEEKELQQKLAKYRSKGSPKSQVTEPVQAEKAKISITKK